MSKIEDELRAAAFTICRLPVNTAGGPSETVLPLDTALEKCGALERKNEQLRGEVELLRGREQLAIEMCAAATKPKLENRALSSVPQTAREVWKAIRDDSMSDCRKSLADAMNAALADQPPANDDRGPEIIHRGSQHDLKKRAVAAIDKHLAETNQPEPVAISCKICGSHWPRYEYAFRAVHIDPENADNRTICGQPEPAIKDGWLPIESAPKDGSRILVATASGEVARGFWHDDLRESPERHEECDTEECGHDHERRLLTWVVDGLTSHQPVGWQPLPPPPASEPQAEEVSGR